MHCDMYPVRSFTCVQREVVDNVRKRGMEGKKKRTLPATLKEKKRERKLTPCGSSAGGRSPFQSVWCL